MLGNLNRDVLSFLLRSYIPLSDSPQNRAPRPRANARSSRPLQTNRGQLTTNGDPKVNAPVVNTEKRVGRNDPCPCGSGKKYKYCHGKGL